MNELKVNKSNESITWYSNRFKAVKRDNKRLKERNETIENLYQHEITELQDRIDKAIEYIHNNQLVFRLSSKKQIEDWFDKFYIDLLNILKGEGK